MLSPNFDAAGCVRLPASGSARVPKGVTTAWMQLHGTSTVQCEEGTFLLRRGDWILLDGASQPRLQTDHLAICMGLYLPSNHAFYPGRGRMWRDEMQIAVRLWRRTGVVPNGKVMAREDLRPLVLLMADLQRDIGLAANRCPGRSIKQRAPLMATLQRTRLYLEGHTLLDHRVDELAAFAGLPARYLSRVFHAVYGVSPLSFAGRVRLDHAVRLLREGEMTVDQIAVTVGYKHRGTFLSALRAHLGLGRMDRIADVIGPSPPEVRELMLDASVI